MFLIMAEGYPNQLVREDRRWLCNLCKHLLREPVLVSCCRHKFCRVCINGCRRKGVNPEECPYCRAPAYEAVIEKDLERMLLDKQVWCSHRFQGCRWKGTLRNALKHEETDCQCTECCQQRHPCRFSTYGCDHIVPLAKEEAHYTEHCQHHLSLVESELNRTKEVLCDSKKKLQDTVDVSAQKLSQKDTFLKEKEDCYKKAKEDLRHVKEELKKLERATSNKISRQQRRERTLTDKERECDVIRKRRHDTEEALKEVKSSNVIKSLEIIKQKVSLDETLKEYHIRQSTMIGRVVLNKSTPEYVHKAREQRNFYRSMALFLFILFLIIMFFLILLNKKDI